MLEAMMVPESVFMHGKRPLPGRDAPTKPNHVFLGCIRERDRAATPRYAGPEGNPSEFGRTSFSMSIEGGVHQRCPLKGVHRNIKMHTWVTEILRSSLMGSEIMGWQSNNSRWFHASHPYHVHVFQVLDVNMCMFSDIC